MSRKTLGGFQTPIAIQEILEGLSVPITANSPLAVTANSPLAVTVDPTAPLSVSYGDGPSLDAFARLRISNPVTIFDSKQIYNNNLGAGNENQPLFWDNQEVSGTGTTTTYSENQASTTLGVSNVTAGKRVRQTKMWFNYRPGKSTLVILTLNFNGLVSGVVKRAGQFYENDGIYLGTNDEGTAMGLGIRSNYTGTPVDDFVTQSEWNIDTMDGTGPSGITLDWTKAQIFFFDYEWLGVGRVRTGFFVRGIPYYTHQFFHANLLPGVYMSSPNLPIRYEIENTGGGAAATLTTICTSVVSEGGAETLGKFRTIPPSIWVANTINANAVGTSYPVVGIRLKTRKMTVDFEDYTALATTVNDQFVLSVHMNPTLNFTPTWNDLPESSVQYALGTTTSPSGAITSPGYVFSSLLGSSQTGISGQVPNAVRLGSTIDGTRDHIWLSVNPLSSNLDILGSVSWRELL